MPTTTYFTTLARRLATVNVIRLGRFTTAGPKARQADKVMAAIITKADALGIDRVELDTAAHALDIVAHSVATLARMGVTEADQDAGTLAMLERTTPAVTIKDRVTNNVFDLIGV